MATIVIRNTAAYSVARSRAHATSPRTTSATPSGVASMPSNVLAYLNLKKKLKVVSNTVPFIAEVASMAGATNRS
jgi:hypothetical protein